MAPPGGGEPPEMRAQRVRILLARARKMLQPIDTTPSLAAVRRKGPANADEAAALTAFVRVLKAKQILPLPGQLVISGDTDATLLRFLRARKLHVERATKMLEDTLAWRKAEGVDYVLENPVSAEVRATMRRYLNNAYHGYDKRGRPLYIELLGRLDAKALLEGPGSIPVASVVANHVMAMEFMTNVLMAECSETCGETVDQMTAIADMATITLATMTGNVMKVFTAMSSVDQKNYPETMGAVYLTNVPWIFSTIFAMVSPFLDERTRKKIFLLPRTAAGNKVVQDNVDPEFLPVFLGGDCRSFLSAEGDGDGWDCLSTKSGSITPYHEKMDVEIARRVAAKAAGKPVRPHEPSPAGESLGPKGAGTGLSGTGTGTGGVVLAGYGSGDEEGAAAPHPRGPLGRLRDMCRGPTPSSLESDGDYVMGNDGMDSPRGGGRAGPRASGPPEALSSEVMAAVGIIDAAMARVNKVRVARGMAPVPNPGVTHVQLNQVAAGQGDGHSDRTGHGANGNGHGHGGENGAGEGAPAGIESGTPFGTKQHGTHHGTESVTLSGAESVIQPGATPGSPGDEGLGMYRYDYEAQPPKGGRGGCCAAGGEKKEGAQPGCGCSVM